MRLTFNGYEYSERKIINFYFIDHHWLIKNNVHSLVITSRLKWMVNERIRVNHTHV
jgi:hypothetical protein